MHVGPIKHTARGPSPPYIFSALVSVLNRPPTLMPDPNSPRPLGEVLKEVITQLDVQAEIDEARVVETWASLAGEDINSVTESVWMKDSTLFVKITSAAWRQELHMSRRKWRDRLNGALESDPVDEIVFR